MIVLGEQIMRKTELIKQLEAIDGDPLVFIDVDGKLSDDICPALRTANPTLIRNIQAEHAAYRADADACGKPDTIRRQVPAIGDPVILI
jgi:hypothetical protein